MKNTFFFLILSSVIFYSFKGGEDSNFKGNYPMDVYKTTILVQYIDSAHKMKWVPGYSKRQAELWQDYKFPYEMVDMKQFNSGLKDSKYKDTDKYRYILKVSMGHKANYQGGNARATTNFSHYFFSFYDRKTDKIYHDMDSDVDFGWTILKHLNKVFEDKLPGGAEKKKK